jgi:hypothetical protein
VQDLVVQGTLHVAFASATKEPGRGKHPRHPRLEGIVLFSFALFAFDEVEKWARVIAWQAKGNAWLALFDSKKIGFRSLFPLTVRPSAQTTYGKFLP